MALTKNPKLALIPSGYKASKVYSVLPSNGVGDFDFSRDTIATRVNKQGLIETVDSNIPRLNYPMIDGVVSGCPSLLLEPSRTNLIAYSNKFDVYWSLLGLGTGSAPVLNNNSIISPDGTQNATEVILNVGSGTTTSDRSSIEVNQTVSAGSEYTVSFYIKGKNDGDQLMVGAISGGYELITLTTEWKRYVITQTAASSPRAVFIGIRQGVFGTLNNNVEFYLYGAQLEQGSYPTSYIPTNGEVNGVTRSAETCNNSGDVNTFNNSEGVLMAEINFENNDTDKGISISDGTSSNRVLFYLATNGNLYGYVFNGNGSIPIVTIIDTNFQINSTAKLAIKYKQNDFSFWVNGIEIGTETIGNTFSSGVLDQLSFTQGSPSANPFYGNVKQLQYFDTALSDEELALLTSL